MRDRSKYWRERSEKRRQDAAYREKQSAWNKSWREANGRTPERLARQAERMRGYTRDPALREHHDARWQVQQAIICGRLVRQPCEVCGKATVDAHHDDYSRPLDVRWLCRRHHIEHHAKATSQA